MSAPEQTLSGAPLVALEGIRKSFGPVIANDGIDLTVRSGEIHALLGENGAGKSTLVKILYGLLQPEGGRILWKGQTLTLASPAQARAIGIGMVFQHFSLFDRLTVAENVALGLDGRRADAALVREIEAIARDNGLALDPARTIHSLSVGERQRVEIVRCLLQDPKLLILDEPTSVLTPQEAEALFALLRGLAARGCAILYITHRLAEVKHLCKRATILRAGRTVASVDAGAETAASLARMMIGTEMRNVRAEPLVQGPVRLAVTGLSLRGGGGLALSDVTFAVRGGEVLAVAGVAGNGQSELFEALSGERLAGEAGAIAIDGVPVGRLAISERRKRGAAFVPEERLGHATAPGLPLSENALLTGHADGDFIEAGLVRRSRLRRFAARVIHAFDVRVGGEDPPAGTLSGGNLQKYVVGREILARPGVLVVNQPTWGVDAGAAIVIRQSLVELAREGAAVLVISQDLDEVFEIADRIAVIHGGHLSQARPAAEMDVDQLGLLMGGLAPERPEPARASSHPVGSLGGQR